MSLSLFASWCSSFLNAKFSIFGCNWCCFHICEHLHSFCSSGGGTSDITLLTTILSFSQSSSSPGRPFLQQLTWAQAWERVKNSCPPVSLSACLSFRLSFSAELICMDGQSGCCSQNERGIVFEGKDGRMVPPLEGRVCVNWPLINSFHPSPSLCECKALHLPPFIFFHSLHPVSWF